MASWRGADQLRIRVILALLTFAIWHAQRSRPWAISTGIVAAAATAIYLTHLLAFVLYGILVGSYELFGRPRPCERRCAIGWCWRAKRYLP